jgi:hypothetical protein
MRLAPFLFGPQTLPAIYVYKLHRHDALKSLGLVVYSGVSSKIRSPFNGRPGFLLPASWCFVTKLANFTT